MSHQIKKILLVTNQFDTCLWDFIKNENPQVQLIDDIHFLIHSRASLLDGKSTYEIYHKEYDKVRAKLSEEKDSTFIFAMLYENKHGHTTFHKIYVEEAKFIIENLKIPSMILDNPSSNKITTQLNKIIKEINKGGES